MVGDLVFNKHHGKNIRLTPYDFFTHTHNEFGEQELAPFAKPTFGRDLEPIPLTLEILEKNGFVRELSDCGIDYSSEVYKLRIIRRRNDEGWTIYANHFGLDKKDLFVHELQHALRLCGIEKEIKLED